MIKINILNQKLIVTNDYQQFWVNFEWFLSLFQISDVKLLLLIKLKQPNMVLFGLKSYFNKRFPRLFYHPPHPSYEKITKISILNTKIIVPSDYNQFYHFFKFLM